MKLSKSAGAVLAFGMLLMGCRQIPDYPAAPQISLNNVDSRLTSDAGGNAVQRITFTINFTDGDGDLGLSTTGRDLLPPFQKCNRDSVVNGSPLIIGGEPVCAEINPNYNNWYTDLFVKRNGVFVPFTFGTLALNFDLRFPRLAPSDKEGPLDGTMTYFIDIIPFLFPANDTAKFEIQIRDRKLNLSNKIQTDVVILNPQ